MCKLNKIPRQQSLQTGSVFFDMMCLGVILILYLNPEKPVSLGNQPIGIKNEATVTGMQSAVGK